MNAVLVTGAAGFIGRYAVGEFLAAGWRVFALVHRTRTPELVALAERSPVTILEGDITRYESVAAAVDRVFEASGSLAAVAHCAGRASDTGRDREFRMTNYESVVHLARVMKERPVGRLVFVSTSDVYGLRDFCGEEELPLAEARHPYPRYKIAAERHLRANLAPDRFAIVRPAAVWGVGDPTFVPRIVSFLRSSPWIVHFGSWRGANRWPLAHVRNVAKAIRLCAEIPAAGGRAITVLDDERTTVDEWYRMLCKGHLPGKARRSVTLPRWAGTLIGAPVSALSNLLNLDHPFMDPSLYAAWTVSSNLDFGNGAFRELLAAGGVRPVTRAEGLRELACEGLGPDVGVKAKEEVHEDVRAQEQDHPELGVEEGDQGGLAAHAGLEVRDQ